MKEKALFLYGNLCLILKSLQGLCSISWHQRRPMGTEVQNVLYHSKQPYERALDTTAFKSVT